MQILNPNFVFFLNLAIPENQIFKYGLGDLIQKKRIPEIEILIKSLLNNYGDIFDMIESILIENTTKNQFIYSDIIDKLVFIYGKEKCFPFTRDLSSFCAKAYFSNPDVLNAYSLLLTSERRKDILNSEIDNALFFSLIKND